MPPRPGSGFCALSLLALAAAPGLAGGCTGPQAPARGSIATLRPELEREVAGFRGRVGIHVVDLARGESCSLRGDDVFPTASLIKVPILVTLFRQVADGDHQPGGKLTYTEDRLYPGEDLLGSFKDGEPITLDKLIWLMITMSDNTASLWLQELVGGGAEVNRTMAGLGLEHTRVNSRTPGRKSAQQRFGWGQTTPREMARLLIDIVQGRVAPAAETLEMRRVLGRSYWDDEALSQIPPDVAVASKQGAVSGSRSEVLVVHAPGGDYALCIITDDQEDRSWEPDNEGWVLIRRVAALCHRWFAGSATR